MVRKEKTTSKTYQVRISTHALQNIDEITGYIAFIKHQPLNAIKVGEAIFETFDRIGNNPYAFRECEELPTKTKIYRRVACSAWTIIYRIKTNEVVVLGIIHSARRPTRLKALRRVK